MSVLRLVTILNKWHWTKNAIKKRIYWSVHLVTLPNEQNEAQPFKNKIKDFFFYLQ